jgi:KAP family P-loop domain
VSSSPSASTEIGEPAEPYVYVFFAGAAGDGSAVASSSVASSEVASSATADPDADLDAERRDAIVENLALLGIPISPDDVFDADVTDFDTRESARLGNAAAVLIFWSKDADEQFTVDAATQAAGHVVVAVLDDVADSFTSVLRRYPQTQAIPVNLVHATTVNLAGWAGDPRDALLYRLADALRAGISRPRLSVNAHEVLARSSARLLGRPDASLSADGVPPSPTDVLLEALAYRPPQGGGVGTDLLRALGQRQGNPSGGEFLLELAAPGLVQDPDPDPGWIGYGPPLDTLLALAEQCAVRVSGAPEVHLRHLLAATALIASPPVDGGLLARLGTSATELPGLLLDVVRAAGVVDSMEAWEQLLAISLAGGFDRDLVNPAEAISPDRDDLDYGVWAAMFASVIADANTPMPMSIGLFGEWGAGKSTFMGLLRGEIAALGGRQGYARDVVSIGFNAWHYADANLWASLGDEIFRALADALKPADEGEPDERQKSVREQESELLTKITAKRGLAEDARARQEQAEKAAKVATERLATQQREARQHRRASALELISALLGSPQVRSAAEKEADRAWQLLGISDDVERGEMLAGQLDGISQDRRALRSVAGWRMTWALVGLCLAGVLLTLAAHVFAGQWTAWLRGVGTWLRHYGGFSTLAAALASAVVLAGRFRAGLAALRSAAELATDKADRKARTKVTAALNRLHAAQARERAADAEVERVNADLASLEAQLAGLAPGRRMYTFLAERAASGDYAGQLGLVSIIRKDLEHLVEVLHEHHADLDRRGQANQRGGPAAPEPRRIDRIVLYIDDLDRCPPRQVVEVLQAVHLLLALDLFVVVVGVDPRWLVRSLHEQYPGILAGRAGSSPDAFAGGGTLGEAVPADYLQKIFNIPFALPAFRDDRLEPLIRRLATGRAAPGAGPTDAEGALTDGAPRGDERPDATGSGPGAAAGTGAGRPDTGDAGRAAGPARSAAPDAAVPVIGDTAWIPAEVVEGTASAAEPGIRAEPGSQVAAIQSAERVPPRGAVAAATPTASPGTVPQRLTEDELRFLGGLGPFIRTPRDAKRLFNVYRMLRSTRDLSPASQFLGREYQAVALLLAMLNQDAHVFAQVTDAPARPEFGVTGGLSWATAESVHWLSFTSALLPEPVIGADGTWRNQIIGEIPAADLPAWRRMGDAVLATGHLVTLPDLTAFREWTPHVRRFSYLVLTAAR